MREKMIQVYKNTIADLNEKMVKYVSPKKFEKTLSKLTELEVEVDNLNKENSKLKNLNDVKNEEIKKFNKEVNAINLNQQNLIDEKNSLENEIVNKKNEIDILTAKLNERTKDLLSLERLVHIKQPDLLPNQTINDSDSFEIKENTLKQINPIFLAQPESLESPEE